MCGVGAELGQAMQELAFDHLDAPVARLHTDALTHPFAPALERAMVVNAQRIEEAAADVVRGHAHAPRRMRSGIAEARLAAATMPAPPAPGAPDRGQTAAAPPPESPALQAPAAVASLPAGEALTMPFGDLTVSEGTLVRWLKQVGEAVRAGEVVVEIETDKAIVEVESPWEGTLAHQCESTGTVVKMGQQIAIIQPA